MRPPISLSSWAGSAMAFAQETWLLGTRTLRRFARVPANPASTILFPVIQLVVFSQLFRGIIALPGFGDQKSYLDYLLPGQIAFTAFFAVAWLYAESHRTPCFMALTTNYRKLTTPG